jgi:hypothetical protein
MQATSKIALLRWLGGPLIWSAYFLIVYASESLICTRAEERHHLMLIAVATIGAAMGLLVLIGAEVARLGARTQSGGAGFMERAGLVLSGLSLLALGWTAMPALTLPACQPMA